MSWNIADQYTRLNRLPGLCSACGLPLRKKANRPTGHEKAVLTGIIIDFEGNIELCETCIGEVAVKLGYVTPEDYQEVVEDAAELRRISEELSSKVSEQSDSIRVLTAELSRALEEPANA